MFTRCVSFVGKGHYIFVGSVSKRFRQAYKDVFTNEKEEETCKTFHQAAASNASVAKYCLDNQRAAEREVRERIVFHAAMKGREDVIKLANHRDILGLWGRAPTRRCTLLAQNRAQLYYNIEEIAEAGHLNILQCLKDDFDMHLGLYKASRGAASGGHLHILKWLKGIDCLRELEYDAHNLCHFAISRGYIKIVKWLQEQGIPLQSAHVTNRETMNLAIESGNVDMIEYCRDRGYGFGADDRYITSHIYSAIMTDDIDVVKYCFENGSQIDSIPIIVIRNANIEILKYFRSKSLSWHSATTEYAAELNKFELLRYAHEDGCEWSHTHG